MLKDKQERKKSNQIIIRKLTHNPDKWPPSLFCTNCADFSRCGGVALETGNNCYIHCCGGKDGCRTVCRKNPDFKRLFREIRGFDLENTPRTVPIVHPVLRGTAPLIPNGSCRETRVRSEIIAIKLYTLVDMTRGTLRFSTREELAEKLKIDPAAKIVVTGIEKDYQVERWWSLFRERRRPLLSEFAKLGLELVTPPNFSLFCNQPRPNDFSAMKRIALVQSEFLLAGIPCALHPHIINETDSKNWISLVAARPEIQSIAYEFATGSGHELVKKRHINHLIRIAENAPQELDLIVRGDRRAITELAPYYRNILYIDTSAFIKTIRRKKAIRVGNRKIDWLPVTTPKDISLEELLQHNVNEVIKFNAQLLLTQAI